MGYNPLEFALVGQSLTGSAGAASKSHATNPGPGIWIYLYADVGHSDPTPREAGLFNVTTSGASPMLISKYPIIPSTGRVAILRPIIVWPGERLRAQISAVSTGAQVTTRGIRIEVPQGQTIKELF